MTLSPVFRSSEAIEELVAKGHIDRLRPSIAAQRTYAADLHTLLPEIIDPRYVASPGGGDDDITFLQEHFLV